MIACQVKSEEGVAAGAGQVISKIRAMTGKPIRFALDTNHHSDHANGNQVFVKSSKLKPSPSSNEEGDIFTPLPPLSNYSEPFSSAGRNWPAHEMGRWIPA